MLVYVPESYRSRRRIDLETDDVEIIWIEFHLWKRVIVLGNIYRPPKAGKELLVDINHMLDSSERKEVILMGDMNINLLKTSRTSQVDELLLITEDHGLTQFISEPTCTDH